MASLGIWHWIIVLAVVVLIFGAKAASSVGSCLVAAIVNFRQVLFGVKPTNFDFWFLMVTIFLLGLLVFADKLNAQ